MKKNVVSAKTKAKKEVAAKLLPRKASSTGKGATARVKAAPDPARAVVVPPASPGPTSENREVLGELRAIRSLLVQDRSVAVSADAALESGVDSLRRLLSETIEKRMEWVLSKVVALRAAVAEAPGLARQIDGLLEELGAFRFTAEAMDHVDPLIHAVVEERKTPSGPEGVIVETIRPGYRTGSGTLLAKACVAVSRRI